MGWSAYEVFTVISGLILIGWALVEDGSDDIEVTPAMRAGAVAAGIFFIGYAIFVANQTTGVWTFPVFIFALPVLALYRVGKRLMDGPASGTPPPRDRPQRSSTPPAQRTWQPSPDQAARFPTAPEAAPASGDADTLPTEPAPTDHDTRPDEPVDAIGDVTVDDPAEIVDDDLTINDPDALRRVLAEQQPSSDAAPPTGWYADPGGADELRWWDGDTWTSTTRARN